MVKEPQEAKPEPRHKARPDLSLGAALTTEKTAALKNQDVKQENVRKSPVTDDAIFASWVRFPSQIRELSSLHFIFTKAPLWDSASNKITIEVSGKLIADEVSTILPKLKKYIHNSLNNDTVDIVIEVDENSNKHIAATPKEKAKAMAEKNNKLRDMCRRLHLDFA